MSSDVTAAGQLLAEAFERVNGVVHRAVEGATQEHLVGRIDPEANTMAWLVWHIARIQDDHIAGVADREQVWTSDGWARRFDLPFDDEALGYGQSADEVGAVQSSAELLLGYVDAVHHRTLEIVRPIRDADLDRVVDEAWDPPVTMGVRLVSVVSDNLQHAGQAAYIRGVLERQNG
jgi:hypothetical protein